MKLSREEKKALKEQLKLEKLEKKQQQKQEKYEKKIVKKEHKDEVILDKDSLLNDVENISSELKANNVVYEESTELIALEEENKDNDINERNVFKYQESNQEQNVVVEEDNNIVNEVLEKEEDGKGIIEKNLEVNNVFEKVEKELEEKPEKKEKVGFFKKIKNALQKTKESISGKIDQIFGKGELNEEFFEDLEDILISSDLGVETSSDIIDSMRQKIKKEKLKTCEEVKEMLREIIEDILDYEKQKEVFPKVCMIVGVNGVGKTTTIGKLANYYKSQGKKVVVVAGDTFRAAASDQLTEWAKRVDVKIVKQTEGADSASVVFDGISFAKSKGFDVVLVDTAGRLHNKVNLMDELSKVNRVATKNWDEATFERFIVIDATTGQNAVNQVKEFNEAVDIDGIILTKLDGSAKGGIVVSICNEYDIPVKFVGVGEGMDDLVPFDAKEFVEGII